MTDRTSIQVLVYCPPILALLFVALQIPFSTFRFLVRVPIVVFLGVAGLLWTLIGGPWGYLGLCLLNAYLQVAVLACFAQIHRSATGRELERPVFANTAWDGKFLLTLYGIAAGLAMLGLPYVTVFAYLRSGLWLD